MFSMSKSSLSWYYKVYFSSSIVTVETTGLDGSGNTVEKMYAARNDPVLLSEDIP